MVLAEEASGLHVLEVCILDFRRREATDFAITISIARVARSSISYTTNFSLLHKIHRLRGAMTPAVMNKGARGCGEQGGPRQGGELFKLGREQNSTIATTIAITATYDSHYSVSFTR